MRSDFSQKPSKNNTSNRKWSKKRLVRALIFVLIGFGIGLWLNNKPKDDDPGLQQPAVAAQHQEPEQVTQPVELPQLQYS